jgi:transcriptional regulator with XRE-family HTH domain
LGDAAKKAAGERLAKVLRVAMARAGIETWTRLAREADVSPTTVDNWIYGETTPRAHHLNKVGRALHPYTSPGDLERAYSGLEPEEPPLIDALRDMLPELHELVVLLRAQADESVLAAVRSALEESRQRRGEASVEPLDPPFVRTNLIDPPPRKPGS